MEIQPSKLFKNCELTAIEFFIHTNMLFFFLAAAPWFTLSYWFYGALLLWLITFWNSASSICGLFGYSSGAFMIHLNTKDW